MMTRGKTVDVIIPVYNGERFIRRSISSVMRQTYLPERILLIDDGSTDKTLDILADLQNEFSHSTPVRIEIYKGQHRGPSAARNIGIQHVAADFVAFLDADDEWFPDKLAKQMRVFETSTLNSLGLVYCETILCADGQGGSEVRLDSSDKQNLFRGEIFDTLLVNNYELRSPSLCLMPTSVVRDVGGFDESLPSAEDWDFFVQIAQKYSVDYVPEVLVRMWSEPQSNTKNNWRMFRGHVRFYKKWDRYYDEPTRKIMIERIIGYLFRTPHMPKIPVHRKSLIGKIHKELHRPVSIRLLSWFI